MKIFNYVFICLLVSATQAMSQASFTITNKSCINKLIQLSASSGTISGPSYAWTVSPTGAAFSNTAAANPTLTFITSGTYTIGVTVTSGTVTSSAQNTIQIISLGMLYVASSVFYPNNYVCPQTPFTMTVYAGAGTSFSIFSSSNTFTSAGTSNLIPLIAPVISALPFTYTVISDSSGCLRNNLFTVQKAMHVNISASSNSICSGMPTTLTAWGVGSSTSAATQFTFAAISPSSLNLQTGTSQTAVVNPSVQTTYIVLADSAGCTSTSPPLTVYMSPPLNITLTASSPTTCIQTNSNNISPPISKPIILNAVGASTYTWAPYIGQPHSSSSLTVRPIATTQYTVLGFNSICSGTAVLTVSLLPQYTIAVSPSQANICVGEAITLSLTQIGLPSFGPYTYSWIEQDQLITTLNSPFGSTVIATPQNKRVYSLEANDANSCVSAPTSLTIDVSPCTEIVENFKFNLGAAFPNPFENELFIQSNSTNLYIELKDCFGRLILSREIISQGGHELIKTENLTTGVYFLNIFSQGEKVQSLKVFKN